MPQTCPPISHTVLSAAVAATPYLVFLQRFFFGLFSPYKRKSFIRRMTDFLLDLVVSTIELIIAVLRSLSAPRYSSTNRWYISFFVPICIGGHGTSNCELPVWGSVPLFVSYSGNFLSKARCVIVRKCSARQSSCQAPRLSSVYRAMATSHLVPDNPTFRLL